eukprot:4612432-Prymnesium_polylepis.2
MRRARQEGEGALMTDGWEHGRSRCRNGVRRRRIHRSKALSRVGQQRAEAQRAQAGGRRARLRQQSEQRRRQYRAHADHAAAHAAERARRPSASGKRTKGRRRDGAERRVRAAACRR